MINTRPLFPLGKTLLLFLTLSGSSFASLPEDYPQESDTKRIERKEAMPLKKIYNRFCTLNKKLYNETENQPGLTQE